MYAFSVPHSPENDQVTNKQSVLTSPLRLLRSDTVRPDSSYLVVGRSACVFKGILVLWDLKLAGVFQKSVNGKCRMYCALDRNAENGELNYFL